MGLDVWFREDVARVLRAACLAGREAYRCLSDRGVEPPIAESQPAVFSREMTAYWRGYQAALATIGAAFGLTWLGEDPSPHPGSRVLEVETNGHTLDAAGGWE